MNELPEADVIRRLEALGTVQPSAGATRRSLDRVRQTLAESQVIQLPSRKRFFDRRWAGAAAVLLIASSLYAWLVVASPSAVRADFASVRAAMKKPATVTCRQTTGVKGGPEETVRLSIRSGLCRADQSDGRYAISDPANDRTLFVYPQKRSAELKQGANTFPVDLYESVMNLPSEVPAHALPEKTMDGQVLVGFAVKVKVQDVAVWANPETQLPVLIEGQGSDEEGNVVVCVLDEFAFDNELSPDLFALDAPVGFKLEVKGVPLSDLTVTPLAGIGPVQFGMSREQAEGFLGKADATVRVSDKLTAMSYASHGFGISFSNTKGVVGITCFAARLDGTSDAFRRDFSGKTDKGITLGSSAGDIVAAYGEPDASQTGAGFTVLHYDGLQTEFKLSSPGKLVEILLIHR